MTHDERREKAMPVGASFFNPDYQPDITQHDTDEAAALKKRQGKKQDIKKIEEYTL